MKDAKEKVKEYNARYYLENKEKFRKNARDYRARNKEKLQAREAQWRADNPDRVKEYNAQYYLENQQKLKEYVRDYQAKNPEKRRVWSAQWRATNPERMKACRRKWDEKNLENYKPRKRELEKMRKATPEGRTRSCAQAQKYRQKYPEKVRVQAMNWHYRTKYGITTAERNQMFEAQGKRCRICQTDTSKGRGFHVDHCHTTKKVRGILCHNCNLFLGYCQDSIATLEAAIAYLKGNK